MPLRIPAPPPESLATLRASLPQLGRVVGGAARALLSASAGAWGVPPRYPHQMYTVEPAELAAGAGFEAARPIGWRYIVGQGAEVMSAEVLHDESRGGYQFPRITEGPFVEQTVKTIQTAERDSRILSGDYELATVLIPALHVFALWLRGTGRSADWLLPMAPTNSLLEADHWYERPAFEQTLQQAARERGQFNNSPVSR